MYNAVERGATGRSPPLVFKPTLAIGWRGVAAIAGGKRHRTEADEIAVTLAVMESYADWKKRVDIAAILMLGGPMPNGKVTWKRLRKNAPVVSAAAITLGLIVALHQVFQIQAVSRSESALSYCRLYLSNEAINRFASGTSRFSAWAEREYKNINIFQEGIPYHKISRRREDIDTDVLAKKFREYSRKFGQLANYFDYAIDGVDRRVFDESIIRDCLSTQIVCFREKYYVRLEIFDHKEMMDRWRKFIAEGIAKKYKRSVRDYCSLATEECWQDCSEGCARC